MSQELIYTSAPRGLKPGTRGFCTVQSTQGMSQPLAERLEALSGYRHLFAAQDAQAARNPVIYSHLIVAVGGRKHHVLSRIADAGQDYTQRSNKFAHHVALDAMELPPGGPASVLAQPGFMQTDWDGEPKLLTAGRRPPAGDTAPAICRHWQELTGDAGWGGALAETALNAPGRQACILFQPGQDLLPLVAEALALLPAARRWQVTFSTWFTKLPAGVDCQWRFLLADSPEAKQARRQQHALLIDLTNSLPLAGSSPLVQAARTGIVPAAMPPPTRHVPTVVPTASEAGNFDLDSVAVMPSLAHQDEYVLGPPIPPGASQLISRRPGKPGASRRRGTLIAATIGATAAILSIAVGSAFFLYSRSGGEVAANDSRSDGPSLSSENSKKSGPNKKPLADDRGIATNSGSHEPDGQGASDSGPSRDTIATSRGVGQIASRDVSEPPALIQQKPDQPPQPLHGQDGDAVGSPDSDLTAQAGAAADPFFDLKRRNYRLDLMSLSAPPPAIGGAPTPSKPVAKIAVKDVADSDIEILVDEKLFGGNVDIKKEVSAARVDWQIRRGVEKNASLGKPQPISIFSLADDTLSFRWLANDKRLCNCLLKLRVGTERAVCFLREPTTLDSTSLDFKDDERTIDIALPDRADTIGRDLLRLRVKVEGIEAALSPEAPLRLDDVGRADSATITIAFRPMHAGNQPTNRDVEVRVKFFESAGPKLKLTNCGVQGRFDQGTYKTERKKLSKEIINNQWKAGRTHDKTEFESQLQAQQEELKQIGPPPTDQTQDDPKKKKRGECESKIKEITESLAICNDEIARCDELVKLLDGLRGNIRFTLYYEVADHEVILAETKSQ